MEHLFYETTYEGTLLEDLKKPFQKNFNLKSDIHDCDLTTVQAMLTPGVCIRNGLYQKDYLSGRKKDVIKDIFTNCDYKFTATEFDKYWKECCQIDKHLNGLVCVETFKNYLEQQK